MKYLFIPGHWFCVCVCKKMMTGKWIILIEN